MMAKIKMSESALTAMRPSTSGSVKELFASDEDDSDKLNKKLNKNNEESIIEI